MDLVKAWNGLALLLFCKLALLPVMSDHKAHVDETDDDDGTCHGKEKNDAHEWCSSCNCSAVSAGIAFIFNVVCKALRTTQEAITKPKFPVTKLAVP